MVATVVLVVVTHVVDVKPQHHRVVFVNRVVTVHRVAPREIAEAEINLYVIVLAKSDDVLAASFDQRRCLTVSFENLVFLEVNVDRMRPIESALEFPNLCRVALHPEANIIAVKEFVVDYPLAIPPVEFEAAPNPFCYSRWHLVESGVGGRIYAVVCHCVGNHTELEHLVPLAGGQNIVRRSCAVALLETVFDMNDASRRERREVNDHIHALGHRDHEPGSCLHRVVQQIAVIGNHPERMVGQVRLGEIEPVEARRSAVEPAETIAPSLDLEERLDLSVDKKLVSQNPVSIGQIEGQHTVIGSKFLSLNIIGMSKFGKLGSRKPVVSLPVSN